MGDEAADPMVRARSQMALVDLLVRHAPEQTLGEPPERQR
jgi:hypothetical protein